MTKNNCQSHIYLGNTFVVEGATCFGLFTNTVVPGGPLISLFTYALQRDAKPCDKQKAFTISQ